VVLHLAVPKPMDDITDNEKHAVNSRSDEPTNVRIEAQRAFSDAGLSAVYNENQAKSKRTRCFVVSGLDASLNNSDTANGEKPM